MKIALYDAFGMAQPWEADEHRESSAAYTRLSEIVDVELPLLPPEVTVPKRLDALAEVEAHLRNEFNKKLSEIMEKRANLLALTHQAAA